MVQEYMFESFDGTELYGKTDSVADPRGVVVIVHGLCEHQGRYDYLNMRLNAQGYSVYRFDHRGHGRSKGTKVFYSAFDEIAKDIDVVVDRAIAENPESPLFIVGHSMGGYGAALYGHLHPGKVDGYVLSGAWTRDNKGLGTGAVEADAPDLAYMPNELGDGVCSDPSVGEAYMADPYVIKEMSFGLFRALHKGHAWMRENASRFVVRYSSCMAATTAWWPRKTALSSTSKSPRGIRAFAFMPVSIMRSSTNTTRTPLSKTPSIGSICTPIWNSSTLRKRKSKATNSQPPCKNAA